MIATGGTVGLACGLANCIIDDTCHVKIVSTMVCLALWNLKKKHLFLILGQAGLDKTHLLLILHFILQFLSAFIKIFNVQKCLQGQIRKQVCYL